VGSRDAPEEKRTKKRRWGAGAKQSEVGLPLGSHKKEGKERARRMQTTRERIEEKETREASGTGRDQPKESVDPVTPCTHSRVF
jgi:hypothetical protein